MVSMTLPHQVSSTEAGDTVATERGPINFDRGKSMPFRHVRLRFSPVSTFPISLRTPPEPELARDGFSDSPLSPGRSQI
jgi:hypothetical protein